MVGFLNAHGTPLVISGQFLSLSFDGEDDVAALENAGLIVFPDVDLEGSFMEHLSSEDEELLLCENVELDHSGVVNLDSPDNPYRDFDPQMEETFYSSLLLGSDYDWDDRLGTPEKIARWIQMRYDDNDTADAHLPRFSGRNRTNLVLTSENPIFENSFKWDHVRGKEHRQPGGWRRYSDRGRERMSIKHVSPASAHRYSAQEYMGGITIFG